MRRLLRGLLRDSPFKRFFLLMWAALVASRLGAFSVVSWRHARPEGPAGGPPLPTLPSLPPTPGMPGTMPDPRRVPPPERALPRDAAGPQAPGPASAPHG